MAKIRREMRMIGRSGSISVDAQVADSSAPICADAHADSGLHLFFKCRGRDSNPHGAFAPEDFKFH
jgi:hypothetical protein